MIEDMTAFAFQYYLYLIVLLLTFYNILLNFKSIDSSASDCPYEMLLMANPKSGLSSSISKLSFVSFKVAFSKIP